MAFTRDVFLDRRPWAYHFTTPQNLNLLRAERAMLSAAAWVSRANAFRLQITDPHTYLGTPRLASQTLSVAADRTVTLNDQLPIQHRGQCNNLQGTYDDFLRCLNSYVFFWPGTRKGPTGKPAKSFANRYSMFGLMRIPLSSLWSEIGGKIRFCRYNSGAPQARARTPRGPQIFVTCDAAEYDEEGVAEIVFPDQIELATTTEWRPPNSTVWQPFFE